MELLRTGRQLGTAVKSAQRLRTILSVFAKYGFADIVNRIGLARYLPFRLGAFVRSEKDTPTPEKLRRAFEELGPTFVKLGQLLSTRPDIVPEDFVKELTRLQDHVQPLPYERVKSTVEKQLGKPADQVFKSFSEKPLAAASIGQVHRATLHSGEEVVVKIQRPEIDKIIQTDISLLTLIAGLLEKYVPESRVLNPRVIVEEFFHTLTYELDYVIEANNMAKMTENMKKFPEIVIPKIYRQFCSHKILVQEYLEGIRVNDHESIEAAGIDKQKVVEVGARAFFHSVVIDGLFHGDLHGGNLFILPGNRLGIIDFGIVGRLSERARGQLANMVVFLLKEDYENLCYQYAELGSAGPAIDFDSFHREVRNVLSPHLGLSLSEMNLGRVLIESTKIAARYEIRIPGDWMIVFKAILTMEGMGRTLYPNFDIIGIGQSLVQDLVKNQADPGKLQQDLLWLAKDSAVFLRTLPRQLRWMFNHLARNNYSIELRSSQMDELRVQLHKNSVRMTNAVLASTLLIVCCLLKFVESQDLLGFNVPIFVYGVLIALSVTSLVRALLR